MGLLDQAHSFAQGASNGVAGSLTGPVDGLAWLLRKAGVPVPQAPLGGSDWMRSVGLMQEPKERIAGLLGEGIGSALPTVIAGKAPQIANGLLQMERNAMAPRTLNPQTGAIVWHGSPHKFDKFDSSKIGTGEGAQAYGHGLYLAENPAIAAGYQDRLSTGYIDSAGGNKAAGDAWTAAKQAVQDAGAKNSDHARAIATQVQDWVDAGKSAKTFLRYNQPPQGTEAQYKAAVDAWTGFKANTGSLYKVDLPDDQIAKMLDWDKPLSQQHPDVQKMLEPLGYSSKAQVAQYEDDLMASLFGDASAPLQKIRDPMGSDIARGGGVFDGRVQVEKAKRLQELGIPGIRYLDGGSRGTGAGTSNFVVFPGNEDILKIMERNGKGLLAD